MENSEFVSLAKLLHAHGTKFMVVGGFAVNHYGYKRTTSDIPGLDPNDYATHYARRNIHLLDGVEIPYISYQDLLLNKEITGRDKDLDDKRNLEKLHSTGE